MGVDVKTGESGAINMVSGTRLGCVSFTGLDGLYHTSFTIAYNPLCVLK